MSDGGSGELDETEVEAHVFRELLKYVYGFCTRSAHRYPSAFTYVALSETPAVTNSSPHTHSRYIYTDDLSPGAFKTVGEHLLLAAHKYVWCSMY